MIVKAEFPYTESNGFEIDASEPSSAATSTSVKTYKTSFKPISSLSVRYSSQVEKLKPKVTAKTTTHSGSTVILGGSKDLISSSTLLSNSKTLVPNIKYSASTWSKVELGSAKQDVDDLTSSTIPPTSPVYPLQSLRTGWDGYWAEPLSKEVLLRAHDLWMRSAQITRVQGDLPSISPAANGSVAFTWSSQHPRKELEIWLYDQSDYNADWLLSVEGDDVEGEAQSQAELLKVISQYQES